MALKKNRLTARGADAILAKGLHADGDGLYLQVSATGARSWIFRYKVDGRVKTIGLGSLSAVSLADARQKAAECRKLKADGHDPLAAKRGRVRQAKQEAVKSKTFKECAAEYLALHGPTWRNPKHKQQWENTLKTYVYKKLGSTSIAEVDTAAVVSVLRNIWHEKPETASRVRGRIEAVLNWAKAQGFRSGENPAAWRGHLDHVLPRKGKVRAVTHHAALPFDQVPAFMIELRKQTALSALAFEFAILTACRTTEVLQAIRDEVDTDKKLWTIPATRMKGSKPHRVPLSARALEILEAAKAFRRDGDGEDYIFPGERRGRPLSNMAFLMLLRRMKRADLTGHGFRSSFRDWAAETTDFPNHVVEMALAHVVGNAVEAAYRRGDLFDKRRKLMEAWAGYCQKHGRGRAAVA